MAKQQSRPARWASAVSDARNAFDTVRSELDTLVNALSELDDVKSEYQDWLDNLPENLQDGPTAEKLTEVTELEFEFDPDDMLSEVDEAISNAENVDLPRGFGRD